MEARLRPASERVLSQDCPKEGKTEKKEAVIGGEIYCQVPVIYSDKIWESASHLAKSVSGH